MSCIADITDVRYDTRLKCQVKLIFIPLCGVFLWPATLFELPPPSLALSPTPSAATPAAAKDLPLLPPLLFLLDLPPPPPPPIPEIPIPPPFSPDFPLLFLLPLLLLLLPLTKAAMPAANGAEAEVPPSQLQLSSSRPPLPEAHMKMLPLPARPFVTPSMKAREANSPGPSTVLPSSSGPQEAL
uniref:Uncharacterized protein n=1 Tax=Glossina austeni TaxID=7395 RepID=A0A1A9VPJ6_GLOAU